MEWIIIILAIGFVLYFITSEICDAIVAKARYEAETHSKKKQKTDA